MATGKQSAKQPSESRGLKNAVEDEVKDAQRDANEGDVETVKETGDQPAEDLPTGQRSHLNP